MNFVLRIMIMLFKFYMVLKEIYVAFIYYEYNAKMINLLKWYIILINERHLKICTGGTLPTVEMNTRDV